MVSSGFPKGGLGKYFKSQLSFSQERKRNKIANKTKNLTRQKLQLICRNTINPQILFFSGIDNNYNFHCG